MNNVFDRTELNRVKTYIMNSFRYCKRVYDGGIETKSQFISFTQLCQNHLNNCNFWCQKFEPKIKFIPSYKKLLYDNLLTTCAYTVETINEMLQEWQLILDKQNEQAELASQIEMRARIEHELAIEYKDIMTNKIKNDSKQIGFNINNEIN